MNQKLFSVIRRKFFRAGAPVFFAGAVFVFGAGLLLASCSKNSDGSQDIAQNISEGIHQAAAAQEGSAQGNSQNNVQSNGGAGEESASAVQKNLQVDQAYLVPSPVEELLLNAVPQTITERTDKARIAEEIISRIDAAQELRGYIEQKRYYAISDIFDDIP